MENRPAVAACRNVRNQPASGAVGHRELAVRHHDQRDNDFRIRPGRIRDRWAWAAASEELCRPGDAGRKEGRTYRRQVLAAARAARAGRDLVGAGVLRSPCRCDRPRGVS